MGCDKATRSIPQRPKIVAYVKRRSLFKAKEANIITSPATVGSENDFCMAFRWRRYRYIYTYNIT